MGWKKMKQWFKLIVDQINDKKNIEKRRKEKVKDRTRKIDVDGIGRGRYKNVKINL